jgi:hypothetical protein
LERLASNDIKFPHPRRQLRTKHKVRWGATTQSQRGGVSHCFRATNTRSKEAITQTSTLVQAGGICIDHRWSACWGSRTAHNPTAYQHTLSLYTFSTTLKCASTQHSLHRSTTAYPVQCSADDRGDTRQNAGKSRYMRKSMAHKHTHTSHTHTRLPGTSMRREFTLQSRCV